MNAETASIPDLLQRFVPAPHVINIYHAKGNVRIETNDLGIALGVCNFCMPTNGSEQPIAKFWKFIRDHKIPNDDMELRFLSMGPLRALLLGTGTMITFDRERREILGFLAPEITSEQLVAELIPLLTDEVEDQGDRRSG